MSEELVQKVGRRIVVALKKKRIPYVKDIILDDFNSSSGRIFIELIMESMTDSRGNMKYFFAYGDKPMRSISAQVRAVIKSIQGISVYNYESPKRTYDSYGEYDGYDRNTIQFDYAVIGMPAMKAPKVQMEETWPRTTVEPGQRRLGEFR